MSDRLISERDGLPARASGAWAEDKLYYVSRYLDVFSTAMQPRKGKPQKWSALLYVDLMAGGGVCRDRNTGSEFDGSPLLAVGDRFDRFVFVEASRALADALRARVAVSKRPDAAVIDGDCNSAAVVDVIRSAFPARSLGVTFADNLALDVTMATLERLSRPPVRTDLLITVMTQDLTRNRLDAHRGVPEHGPRFDAFFGTPAWRDHADGRATGIDRLLDFYKSQLMALGYGYCRYSPTAMKNSKNGELYRLLLASRHERAIDLFDKVCMVRPDGQRSMLF